ncbi:acyl carrier protein [Brevibacillus sp. SYP-B805]|uniref:acyl carrier protein n=1 Tax=Brevibacillus sp. SYP-B805 TaxID=1578199 RepID=UPI0013ECE883|nr:acyl carrier protein [Brevibacillus sp. SYP-B805]NGQ95652.1 acyl carrier protein [Brevibacillus sp. SYP-B805]
MEEKLREVFARALDIPEEMVKDELEFNSIPQWDSIGHLGLIAALDEAFGIMIETEDVIDMSSFKKAKEILAKYGVQV